MQNNDSKLKIIILIVIALILSVIFLFFRFSPVGTAVLWNWSGGGKILLPLVLVSALIDSINPCAFSILLLTIAFLFSIGQIRRSILKIGGSYIFGIFSAYILIGLGILGTLHIFNTPHFMGRLGAILLIVLGIINSHFTPMLASVGTNRCRGVRIAYPDACIGVVD